MKRLKLLLIGVSAIFGLVNPAAAQSNDHKELTEINISTPEPLLALQQSQADLDKQREAERILKEAERVRQENRNSGGNNGYTSPNLEQRTNGAVDRLRDNFGNDQKLRESQAEVERLRQERIRIDQQYRWDSYYYPYATPVNYPQEYRNLGTDSSNNEFKTPAPVVQQLPGDSPPPGSTPEVVPVIRTTELQYVTPKNLDLGTATLSVGVNNGAGSTAVGYRFAGTPIAIEAGLVFNQDSLPAGQLNEYSVPGSLLQQFPTGFNDLGSKTVSPQVGADLLGYFDVSPGVSLYGGVGLYFQGRSTIFQSKATTDLFKQTNSTDVNVAYSGGADFKLNDAWRLGGGYHSLRGVNARISYSF
jgi:opacity protein-like surface antigen